MSTTFVLFCVFGSLALVAPWVGPWLIQVVGNVSKGFTSIKSRKTTAKMMSTKTPPIEFRDFKPKGLGFLGFHKEADGSVVIGGGQYWLNEKDEFHRTNGPAVVYATFREWWVNGKFQRRERFNNAGLQHCATGPAIEWADGRKEWYQNGQLHRESGPAIECADGGKAWYQNGLAHRLDGPAMEYADGKQAWRRQGRLHREDGPATVTIDGERGYYLDGEWQKTEIFNKEGRLHCTTAPAFATKDGERLWYLDGKLHREGGPAWVDSQGNKRWYQNHQYHRLDGPAIERLDGSKWWYAYGGLIGAEIHFHDGSVSEQIYEPNLRKLSEANQQTLIFKGGLPVKLPPLPKKTAVA